MLALHFLLFAGGLVALLIGGDALVRGASATARSVGVSPLVVGLTVVSFGTSAPELAVSLTSGLSDSAPLALGNVVGSNIFNILLVLGMAALFRPLNVQRQLIYFDMPVMAITSVALVMLSVGGWISWPSGLLLCALLLTYLSWTIHKARQSGKQEAAEIATRAVAAFEESAEEGSGLSPVNLGMTALAVVLLVASLGLKRYDAGPGGALIASLFGILLLSAGLTRWQRNTLLNLGLTAVGIGAVVMSANCLVDGAVGIAHWMGVSDAVIGLTVVAAGTSLPEAVTSMMAAAKGESDLAIGNVVGSNIFNTLCIVGLTSAVVALPVAPELMRFDYAVMVATGMGLWWVAWRRQRLGRLEGAVMLACFVGYVAAQVVRVI